MATDCAFIDLVVSVYVVQIQTPNIPTQQTQIYSENRPTTQHHQRWRSSYVQVVSTTSVANGSINSRPLPVAPSTTKTTTGSIPASSQVTQLGASERKKRQAPQPPGTGAAVVVQTSVGSPPNGSLLPRSGYEDGSAPSRAPPAGSSTLTSSPSPVSDDRTPPSVTAGVASVYQPTAKPERTKRLAPSAPVGKRTTTSDASAQNPSSSAEPIGGQKSIPVTDVADDITLNMSEVEFCPPERPRTWQVYSPERDGDAEAASTSSKNPAEVESPSLSPTETESTAVNGKNGTLTETLPGGTDNERCLEVDQRRGIGGIEYAAEMASRATNGIVSSDRSQYVVHTADVTSARNSDSQLESEEGNDRDSTAGDHTVTASLQKSVESFSYTDGNFPSTQSADGECDVHMTSDSPAQTPNCAVSSVKTSEDENSDAPETAGRKLAEERAVASPEVVHDSQSLVIDIAENRSPETTQMEPKTFKISEKDVRQKRDELAPANRRSFDTAWQSSGDGGRFRIRSMAKKNVSYSDVFGESAETRARSPTDDGEFPESCRRTAGITANAKSLHDVANTVNGGEGRKGEEDRKPATVEDTELNKTAPDVSDKTATSHHQHVDLETVPGIENPILTPEPEDKDDKIIRPEKTDRPSADADTRRTVASQPDVDVEVVISQDTPSRNSRNISSPEPGLDDQQVRYSLTTASPTTVLHRSAEAFTDKAVDNRKIMSSSESPDSEEPAAKPAGAVTTMSEIGGPRDVNEVNTTARPPETIVIDKSRTSSFVGMYKRRTPAFVRASAATELTFEPTQWVGGAPATTSSATAASADENKLQQRSSAAFPRNVSEKSPGTESAKSGGLRPAQNTAAGPAETSGLRVVEQNRRNPKSTVIRVVNGRIVQESEPVTSSSAEASTFRSPAPEAVGNSNVTVVHCEQSPTDSRSPSRFDVVANGGSDVAKTTENFTTSVNSMATSTAETSKVSEPRLQTANKTGADGKSGGRKSKQAAQNDDNPAVGSASVKPAQVRLAADHQSNSSSYSTVASKPPSFRQSASIPADKESASTSATSPSAEQPNTVLAQARSMLRPTNKPPDAYEVPPNDGGGDTSASKFVLRSTSSSSRRIYAAADVKKRSVAGQKPPQAGIGSKNSDDPVAANQSLSRTSTSRTTPSSTGTGSASRSTVKNSSSTSVRNNGHQSSVVSSPTNDEVDASQTSTVDVKPKYRSQSETWTVSSSEVETEKPKVNMPSLPRATSQDQGVKRSAVNSPSESESSSDVLPAAASLASLQPAKTRTVAKPLPSPKLSLHEQLMIAIRDAGGSVPTTNRSRSVDASSSSSPPPSSAETSTSVSIYRSPSRDPASTNAPAAEPTPEKRRASSTSAVVAAKRTSRVIEPPKPTPHEQLMMAIRNAGGVSPRKFLFRAQSAGTTTSFPAAVPSTSQSSTASEKAETWSVAEESTPSSTRVAAADSHADGSPARSSSDTCSSPRPTIPPPPPPSLSPTFTTAAPAPKPAARTTASGTASSHATRGPPPPQLDVHEALLAAIRDAAGGKGLRKVSIRALLFLVIII